MVLNPLKKKYVVKRMTESKVILWVIFLFL